MMILNCHSCACVKAYRPLSRLVFLTFVCLLAILSTSRADLNTGLVAYYPFNGNANDESGNGNNGVVYDAALTTNRFGSPSSAYSFNGSSSYIVIPKNSAFDLTTQFTISVWIYQTDSQYAGYRIVDKCNSGTPDGISFDTYGANTGGRQLRLQGAGTGSPGNVVGATQYSLFKWHHVVATVSGIVGKVYLDGTLDGTGDAGNIPSNNLDIFIGRAHPYSGGTTEWFKGIIDDLSIYNRALSAAEVGEISSNGVSVITQSIVSNVRASQRAQTRLVDIFYNLVSTNGLSFVSVSVSTNNGVTYDLPSPSMSNGGSSVNSIGTGVAPGQNKWVVWNAGADWGGQYSDKVRFRINAAP